jgi:hypothetical protein
MDITGRSSMDKYRVKEACSVALGESPEVTFKTGVGEAKPGEAEALEHLVALGKAERVKASDKEE